jgi:tetratricopeptide (TPR) repeat protein
MLALIGRAATRLRLRAAAFVGGALLIAPGCALIPTWDDVHNTTSLVKDTVSGKARRDRQTQAYAEARIMERRHDYAGAEKLYRQLLTELPTNRDCYHRLAVMAAVQGKFEEANKLYRSALDCGSPTADLWSDLGYCHYLQHQLPEAEGALRQAIALTPQHSAAQNNLALVLGEQGNLDEAYRYFRQANKEAMAEANFAFLCAQCGDLPRAQKHYSHALSIDPELRTALDGLFQVTQRMQRLQQQSAQTAGGPAAAPNGEVQQVNHEAAVDNVPQRPLIEVFTARSARPNSGSAATPTSAPAAAPPPADAAAAPGSAVQQLAASQAATQNSPPPTRPYLLHNNSPAPQPGAGQSNAQLPPPGQPSNAIGSVPTPYSYQAQPQPQYLQPTSQPRTAQQQTGSSGAPTNDAGAAALNAGGPYPPLVGGASAVR